MVVLFTILVVGKQIYLLHVIFGYSMQIAIDDAICSTSMLALSLWLIILLIRTYPTKVTLFTYSLLISFGLALASVVGEYNLLKLWLRGNLANELYLDWLKNSLPVRFLITWIFYSWMGTNTAFRKNIAELNNRFQAQTDAAALLKEAELYKLRQQLQPHFLYNSLNSISALVMISPEKAQEMIGKLSDFMRGSVKREGEEIVQLKDEIDYIESYLSIESVRFGDRLRVSFSNQAPVGSTIPPYLFQPILENAIKFGLYGNTGNVEISVAINIENDVLKMTVTNPYDQYIQPPKGTGFGLKAVARRLYLVFARTDLLETYKTETTFTTILKIPQPNV